MTPCAVPDCSRPLLAKSYCRVHYERWRRHGDPAIVLKPLSPRGAPRAWLRGHAGHVGSDCLIWPFSRHPDGRAHMNGVKPSRFMCSLAHGPPPTPGHEAAHSCGNGHLACVHPQHLRWATPVENAADKVCHGTVQSGEQHYAAKLTAGQVREIRGLRGSMLQRKIAARFGVKLTCINKVLNGRSWRDVA